MIEDISTMNQLVEPNKINLAIIGGRDFSDYQLVKSVLAKVKSEIVTIVSGGAIGADTLGAQYANEFGIPLLLFLPEWDKYGKRAAFLRNTQIIDASQAVIAFWDGFSKGTAHSIELAKRNGIPVHIVKY